MRRARHKLQVSTFPFLAVLLGAMGALILLLLVMDRRSKIVARTRAIEAHAAQLALRAKMLDHHLEDEEARQAEWERKRRELHDLLREQEEEVAKERQGLTAKLKALGQDLRKEETALQELEQRLHEERTRLDVKSQLLSQIRQGIARSTTLDAASRQEVENVARDLAQLERALREAMMLKTQEQETYSLVPYRGKLREGRRPVYVECAPGGIIFHPERGRMDNPEFDVQLFRNEVQRRGVELVREKRDADRPSRPPVAKVNVNPYVLFLVRPDGLESYYNATTALRGFDIDYGYEFVDAHWVLDFSQEVANGGQKLPLREASLSKPRESIAPKGGYVGQGYPGAGSAPGLVPSVGATSPHFGPVGQGAAAGLDSPFSRGAPGGAAGSYSAAPTGPGNGPWPGTGGFGTGQGGPAGPGANPQLGPGGYQTAQTTRGPGGPGVGPQPGGGGFGGGQPGLVGTGNGQRPGLEGSGTAPGTPSDGGPAMNPQSEPRGYGTGQATTGPAGPGVNLKPGPQGNDTTVGTQGPAGSGTNPQPGAGGAVTAQGGKGPAPGNPGEGSPSQAYSGQGTPQDVAWRASPGSPAQGTGAPNPVGAAQGTIGPGQAAGTGGSANDSGTMDPLARLTPNTPFSDSRPGPKKAVVAPSVGRLLANRDYLVTIECFGDVTALYPGGQVFAVAHGAEQKKVDEALVAAVLQLIARRQATVRSGEVPYRPMLRFQVHPEALRTYFHVYPLFENLRIPMTRENLDS